ncbi:dienelactone hydrolase family protein [Massilia pinisoli]|uniref:Dienelactone hydrolase family protein n=1 Tax=Massilia pinisoli TaxID=1772194 RepID=A0ABT1ZZ92_9BURK|nr:dienelactone hydrolase family protein [Massilia pinisoli]MCS0585230.1 dienelactone hydrolase family protein [Massilia pinisoli]
MTTALIHIDSGTTTMEGMLELPRSAAGVVLFAHGSGSSRLSPRNNHVARVLRDAGIGTLLLDLLTPGEDRQTYNRFDIALLVGRLRAAAAWLGAQEATTALPLGLFGASTGAAAALQLAADPAVPVAAVVSRGGRPDLAGLDALRAVEAPTLLIVGGADEPVIALNEQAYAELGCVKRLMIVPGATHLFEEPGTLDEVARLAADWFAGYFAGG